MNCKHAQKLISKSVDGLMNPSEKALLDRHLAQCPRCSEEHADLVSLDCVLSKALPLQETLGDGFATRVAERLPARGSRLSILKEAFVMSRIRYAVFAAVVMAIAIGYLFAPNSNDSRALAAVQSSMAKVESFHYRFDLIGPKPLDWQSPEVWSTWSAMKSVDAHGWQIVRGGAQYYYNSRHKTLFITPGAADIRKGFGMMADPREIVRLTKDPWVHVTVQDTERDGKPMQQIEVEYTSKHLKMSKETTERRRRLFQRMGEIIEEQDGIRGERDKAGRRTRGVIVEGASRSKSVYLVAPSTNLVQSIDFYIPNKQGGGWTLFGRVASIDYNVHLPGDFFDTKTPPGTRVYDLRNDPEIEKDTTP